MAEWTATSLGALCAAGDGTIQTGPFGSQLHADEYSISGVPVVMPQDIGDNVINTAQIARVPDEVATRMNRHYLEEGDIVFSRRGDVTRRALVRDRNAGWLCGTGCLRVRPGKGVHSLFLSYRLGTTDAKDWLLGNAVGTNMLNLNTTILGRLPLDIPPLPEQQAIAEVLGALDDKIAANTALAATAREYALTKLRIDAPTTPLGNVVLHRKHQVNPAELDEPLVEHYSLPAFDVGTGPEVTDPGNIQSNKFRVEASALLVSKLNPRTPRNWPVSGVGERPRLASTEFLVLEPFVCDPWVMWALVSQSSFTRELEGKVAGTSGSHQRVRPEEVLATPILDPRSLHPQLIADVSEVLAPIDAFDAENRTLAATRGALLPQLMSGKIRVGDAERIVSEAGV